MLFRSALTAAHTPAGPPPATTTSASSHGVAGTGVPFSDALGAQPPAAANAATAPPDKKPLRSIFMGKHSHFFAQHAIAAVEYEDEAVERNGR